MGDIAPSHSIQFFYNVITGAEGWFRLFPAPGVRHVLFPDEAKNAVYFISQGLLQITRIYSSMTSFFRTL